MATVRESGPPVGTSVRQRPSGGRPAGVWRRRLTGTSLGRVVYRVAVAVLGGAVVVVGLVLVPAPGPGWLVVFAGLTVLATEFAWARRLLAHARGRVARAAEWTARQRPVVRALLGLGGAAFTLALLWAMLVVIGVPAWLPDTLENAVHAYVPGV